MTDTTTPQPNHFEHVVDRNRLWNPRWFQWLKKQLETVRSTAAEVETQAVTITETNAVVTEVQDDVASIKAEWAIEINGNGQIIGAVRLDSLDAYSTFTVVADKFRVAHPTASGTTVTAFIVDQVDGVSTVGINGNLLVDGSILARSLDVDTLSAITADVGTVTAGRIQSADGNSFWDLDNNIFQIGTN